MGSKNSAKFQLLHIKMCSITIFSNSDIYGQNYNTKNNYKNWVTSRHPERDGTWAHCARAINMFRAIGAFELLVMIVKMTATKHQNY